MKKYKLSIIIPTWNTAEITLKCISTINKFLPKNFAEIIIVDNGSTDNTFEIFKKIKNIVYIRNSENLGFAKGNNVGAKKATGKYLLFLNSDMELIDDQLVHMVEYFDSNPNVGLIGPRFLNPDLTPQGSVLPPQTPINAFKEYWLGQKTYSKYTPSVSVPTSVANISGGAVIISQVNFNKIGGWDERYFFYYEDLELCRQIHKLRKLVYYYPNCQVIHRHGASGTKITNSENQWRRLIPSSIIYHGSFEHYLIFLITWTRQKLNKILEIRKD